MDAEEGDEFVPADDKDEAEIDVDDGKDLVSAEKRFGIRAKTDVVGEKGD